MIYSHLILHFGELSTKGLNKGYFIGELVRSINRMLKKKYPSLRATSDHAHAYIALKEEISLSALLSSLEDIAGIQRITPVCQSERDLDSLKKNALLLMKEEKFSTFKVHVRRPDHTFPISGYEIARTLGGTVLANIPSISVDVNHPECTLEVEIRSDAAYLSCHSYPGAGGYPSGCAGRSLMLLSGGIDSPVASYLLFRRGLRLDFLHFAAPPYTSSAVIDKLADLLHTLSAYQEKIVLHVVPFTNLQLSIYEHTDEPYCITLMRRMMLRIASIYAEEKRIPSLATGESVGQVASQTVESMRAINAVTSMPILRPLVAMDKLEIMKVAKKIGTYDISIRPYEDCCTIFKPKKPKTKPKEKECLFYESRWDYNLQIEEAVEQIKSYQLQEDGTLLLLEKENKQ